MSPSKGCDRKKYAAGARAESRRLVQDGGELRPNTSVSHALNGHRPHIARDAYGESKGASGAPVTAQRHFGPVDPISPPRLRARRGFD